VAGGTWYQVTVKRHTKNIIGHAVQTSAFRNFIYRLSSVLNSWILVLRIRPQRVSIRFYFKVVNSFFPYKNKVGVRVGLLGCVNVSVGERRSLVVTVKRYVMFG
jgi:hypothetical protein